MHKRFPSFLARVVFPEPGLPVMMMHFGFLSMLLEHNAALSSLLLRALPQKSGFTVGKKSVP
jgi:hypothetical protein